MKQITITVPDNCELKQDGNTYTIVEKEKKPTYEDIIKELFLGKSGACINVYGGIMSISAFDVDDYAQDNNCTSEKQAKKLLAINMLMNVAKYLNDGWWPDWNNHSQDKWLIYCFGGNKELCIGRLYEYNYGNIYFKSEELARQAIDVLGEETIKLALSTNY